ncbi:MAG: Fe-S cluster assembly protein SufD [Actinomycetaceae bacterium]|nr:Fe-S cluster assembly protein SufD [Actinomycetaceae bacterium]
MSVTETMSRAHSHGAGTQKTLSSRADRPTSFDVNAIATPGGREEDWRFTPLRRIEALFDPANYSGQDLPVKAEVPQPATYQVVDVDDQRCQPILAPGDRTAVVSWDRATSVHLVDIPAGAQVADPIVLQVESDSEDVTSQRIYVRCGENAEAVVLINHRGKAKLNQTVEIDAADEARLTVVSVHEWDDDATHASNHRMRAGANTQLRHIVVTLGGDLVRICADTEFASPRGHIEMLGLYFVDEGQHLEHRPYIAHTQPNCYSRVTYKGALQGKSAHSVWVGDCLIGRDADGTDTYELNRNLVLTEGAKADSVPNLEIENGEIEGAGHASATGRFDDEQLFYLMSRGVSEMDARRLVVRGFFAELIQEIGIPQVQDHLMEAIEAELEAGGVLSEGLETEAGQ